MTKNASAVWFLAILASTLILSGCASAKPVTRASLQQEMSLTKAEAMKVVEEALNNRYYRIEITEAGFVWKEYLKMFLNQVDVVPINSGEVVFSEVREIKTSVNFQGGGYILYGEKGKRLFVSGLIRDYKEPEILNRIVAAYLVLCPNANRQ